jgi:hypothetical protein
LVCISHLFHACYMPRLCHPPSFDYPNNIWCNGTRYEAPHYAVFSILRPLPPS